MKYCHPSNLLVSLSPVHLVTPSPLHPFTPSPCHLVTLSPVHLVTLSPVPNPKYLSPPVERAGEPCQPRPLSTMERFALSRRRPTSICPSMCRPAPPKSPSSTATATGSAPARCCAGATRST